MFRKMRRFNQQLSDEACEKLLLEEKRGTLCVNGDDGYPYGLPVDFYYDKDKKVIYIHGAKTGHKIDAIKNNDKVCFTTWNAGTKVENDWYYEVDSVIVFGRAELLSDASEVVNEISDFGLKYAPKEYIDGEIKKDLEHVQMIVIHIEQMTGKHVKEH